MAEQRAAGGPAFDRAALAPLAAVLMFWAALFAFAAMRPDYSHARHAVSELGAWGAPHMWSFNILGFIAPGILLAAFGWALGRSVAPSRRVLTALLCLQGAAFVVAGIFPADMNDYQSLTTIAHMAGSMASLPTWFVALAMIAWVCRKTWPALSVVSVVAILAMIGAFSLYGLPDVPRAIVQRATFAVFFAWYVAAALLFARRAKT